MASEVDDDVATRPRQPSGRVELPNLRVKWPAPDLGHFAGAMQQHLDGIGMRLGSFVEESRGNLLRRVPKFEPRKLDCRMTTPGLNVVGMAQSWISGLAGWRDDMWKRIGQARFNEGTNFGRAFGAFRGLPSTRAFASLSTSQEPLSQTDLKPSFQVAMTTEQVSGRLGGVPVYTVSNSENEFVLISDINQSKSLGIFCFRREDAEALLSQVRDREPSLGRGARVVAVSLDKVYQLNTEGIAFRFLPDPRQVKNALEANLKSGETRKAFDGVPVFQSDNLILRNNNKRFCPIFFCKEDLERALSRAFKQQQRVNPNLRVGTDIQVGSFEDVLKRMEANETESGWGDIVFIPPGIDAFTHLGKPLAQASGRETVVT